MKSCKDQAAMLTPTPIPIIQQYVNSRFSLTILCFYKRMWGWWLIIELVHGKFSDNYEMHRYQTWQRFWTVFYNKWYSCSQHLCNLCWYILCKHFTSYHRLIYKKNIYIISNLENEKINVTHLVPSWKYDMTEMY